LTRHISSSLSTSWVSASGIQHTPPLTNQLELVKLGHPNGPEFTRSQGIASMDASLAAVAETIIATLTQVSADIVGTSPSPPRSRSACTSASFATAARIANAPPSSSSKICKQGPHHGIHRWPSRPALCSNHQPAHNPGPTLLAPGSAYLLGRSPRLPRLSLISSLNR